MLGWTCSIVWAKEFFKLLFGNTSESMLYEAAIGDDVSTYMGNVAFPPLEDRNSDTMVRHMASLVTAVFQTEVMKQIDMKIYKTSKSIPEPLSTEAISEGCEIASQIMKGNKKSLVQEQGWERHVWSDAECIADLIVCTFEGISQEEGQALMGSYAFDKDNKFSMRFVTAASNLRSRIFHILPMSYHDAKGVAGNIIPAIASTNAIIAGLQVAQAIQIICYKNEGKALTADTLRTTYCQRLPTRRGCYLQPTKPDPASSSCYVCNTSQQQLEVTLRDVNVEASILQ